jgi:hypothetical protein
MDFAQLKIKDWSFDNNLVYESQNGPRMHIALLKDLILVWQHINEETFESFCITSIVTI